MQRLTPRQSDILARIAAHPDGINRAALAAASHRSFLYIGDVLLSLRRLGLARNGRVGKDVRWYVVQPGEAAPNCITAPQAALLQRVRSTPDGVSMAQLMEETGRTVHSLGSMLRYLRDSRLIGTSRHGLGAVWVAAEHLERVQAEARATSERKAQERQNKRLQHLNQLAAEGKDEDDEPGGFTHIHRPAGEWQINHPVANNSVFNIRA